MPLYEYECENCGKVTESLRSTSKADRPIACEHCKSKKTHRLHSVFAAGSSQADSPMSPPPCGACGDPRGSCTMN